MNGFLGTRASFIVDLTITISAILPLLLLLTFYFASIGKYKLHKNLQLLLIFITLSLVIALELGIRTHGSNTNSFELKMILIVHLFFAITSFIGWIYLAIKSLMTKDMKFDFDHKKWGKLVYIGLCCSIVTGWILYFFAFVF